jgi:hypothetical protein
MPKQRKDKDQITVYLPPELSEKLSKWLPHSTYKSQNDFMVAAAQTKFLLDQMHDPGALLKILKAIDLHVSYLDQI